MIRVLFIHYKLVCGGAEQALYDLICLMDKSKFDITVLAQVEGGEWEQKFRDAGIKVIYEHSCQIASSTPMIKLKNFIIRRKLRKALQNNGRSLIDKCFPNQFDLIVSYHIGRKFETAFAENCKTIKYIHGDVDTNEDYREDIIKIKPLLNRYDRIICVSQKAKKGFCKLINTTDFVEMHYNPLNSKNVLMLSNQSINVDFNEPTICAVGRLGTEKGFSRLVFIHKRLLDKGFKHKLIIVGDGDERKHIEEIIRGTKTQDSVIMAGYQSNPYPYMKNCRFMVNSSYTEGLPVIAMEALALGTPIVSAVPSIGELFGDEICGIITENDDESLENGIEKMLSDEDFYQKAKRGAEARSSIFDGQAMVKEIEDLFINVMNN